VKQHALILVVVTLFACGQNSQQVTESDLRETVDRSPDEVELDLDAGGETDQVPDDVLDEDASLVDGSVDACSDYGEPVARGRLPAEVDEASGLAVSSFDPGILWSHNDDSGGDFDVFAVNGEGGMVAGIDLDGVDFIDWEDMAGGPCPQDASVHCLYIGDIGDNLGARQSLSVYAFPEPDPREGDVEIDDVLAMELTYPDGAHNSEALFVGSDSRVYLLTKEANQFRLYATDFSEGVRVLEYFATVEVPSGAIRIVTAADLSADGSRLLVRTYTDAFEYRLDGPVEERLSEIEPSVVPTAFEIQGEAIAYAPEGGYWHVSEGNEPTIYQVSCAE